MNFFQSKTRTPIRRIAIAAFSLAIVSGCNKLGLGNPGTPTSPTNPLAPGAPIVYSALGASDANGVGSSVPCVPFDQSCPGMGYVYVTARDLRSRGYSVSLTNLGIATAVIGRDFQSLGQQYNHTILANLIESEMPFIDAGSTMVTMFTGINEINVITAALGGGAAGGSDVNGYIDNQVRAFSTDYNLLLTGARAKANGARIVVLNVPNAAGLPYLARASAGQRQAAQRAAVGMARAVNATPNATIVDLMCDSRSYLASNYSGDGMHPNDSGYAFMATEIERAVTTAGYPAPQPNCSQMSLVQ
jgi:lysophospholipase L1-like esterase